MMLSLGKYTANFNALGALSLQGERWTGKWHIYDTSSGSGDPVAHGATSVVRQSKDAAQEDARRGAIQQMQEMIDATG